MTKAEKKKKEEDEKKKKKGIASTGKKALKGRAAQLEAMEEEAMGKKKKETK